MARARILLWQRALANLHWHNTEQCQYVCGCQSVHRKPPNQQRDRKPRLCYISHTVMLMQQSSLKHTCSRTVVAHTFQYNERKLSPITIVEKHNKTGLCSKKPRRTPRGKSNVWKILLLGYTQTRNCKEKKNKFNIDVVPWARLQMLNTDAGITLVT